MSELKVGIKSMTYNKNLRIFETTLVNGAKGPDISIDAIIAKDGTVEELKKQAKAVPEKIAELEKLSASAKEKATKLVNDYNTNIAEMTKVIDDIERVVTL